MRQEMREIKQNFNHRRRSPSSKVTDNGVANRTSEEHRKSDNDDDRIEEGQDSTSRRSSSLAT